jgi:hypothetical protein
MPVPGGRPHSTAGTSWRCGGQPGTRASGATGVAAGRRFDCQGYQTAVVDRNGNEADFTYTERNSANKPVKFLDYITDPTGRQTLTLSYYNKGDNYSFIDSNGNVASGTNLTNPKIIDEVKSVTDISGRTVTFLYTTQGLMAQMTDGDGSPLTKTFKFGYDMTQGNKNVKLVSVTDPRIHTTNLAYYTAPQDPKFKWSLNTLTDRRAFTQLLPVQRDALGLHQRPVRHGVPQLRPRPQPVPHPRHVQRRPGRHVPGHRPVHRQPLHLRRRQPHL